MPKVAAPKGLGTAGRRLWTSIASKWELRADEARLLEDAAGEADLIATLIAGLDGLPLMMKGSTGQDIVNPIYGELRQHRSTLRALLAQLKLPDANPEAAAGERSANMRAVVNARWSKRGA